LSQDPFQIGLDHEERKNHFYVNWVDNLSIYLSIEVPISQFFSNLILRHGRRVRKSLLLFFEEFNGFMGGNDHLSAIQRKHMFERYKGRYVRWWGEVEEVIKGISGDYTLRAGHSQTAENFEVSIRFDKSRRQKLLRLTRGEAVNYVGRLTDLDPQLGYYLEDGDNE
jgi:hypothetical protein